ncbi:MAG: restriction endonuclease [Chloroflexi bacterium]|nr:restriction endonuclease [Chloroflexota bacterium]
MQSFFQEIGWFQERKSTIPIPLPGQVIKKKNGILQQLLWKNHVAEVFLENVTKKKYLYVEEKISNLFSSLNAPNPKLKNREAICEALEFAVTELPSTNPSDIYQHVIYRLYIREYKRSKAEQSWVRAGGEGVELFIERHYVDVFRPYEITIRALLTRNAKALALDEMGLSGQVGNSKLDIALYGQHQGRQIIFGGIHCKASLAERVSDDVPCSEAMMHRGLLSVLYTFDSKSFPPPRGDLINRGELGSPGQPSDKRKYIEDHGSFEACFSYNLRTVPSKDGTKSGKKIYVSSLTREDDIFPTYIIQKWNDYRKNLA